MENKRNSRLKSHKEVYDYILYLKEDIPQRKEEAKHGLIETGVLSPDGKKKETIVDWE